MSTIRTRTALSLAAVAGLCVGALPAHATSPSPVPDLNESIVWVDVETPTTVDVPWEEGSSTSYAVTLTAYCTGFFVSAEGQIATAGHCVEPDDTDRLSAIAQTITVLKQEGYDMTGFVPAELDWPVSFGRPTAYVGQPSGVRDSVFGGDMMIAQVVDWQPMSDGDNALLRVADLVGTAELPVATQAPQLGEPVTAIGFPGSVSDVSDISRQMPSYKTGSVSSRQYTDRGVPNTEIDAAVSGGMSGGPTVNAAGEVIGVNSFGIHGESQPFNFVTDTETMRDFLSRNGVELTSAGSGSGGAGTGPGTPAGSTPEPTGEQAAEQTGEETGAQGDGVDETAAPAVQTAAAVPLAEPPVAVDAGSDAGADPWLLLVIGVLVLLLAGGGVWLIPRRAAPEHRL